MKYCYGVYARESSEETKYQCEDRKDCQCSYQPVQVNKYLYLTKRNTSGSIGLVGWDSFFPTLYGHIF